MNNNPIMKMMETMDLAMKVIELMTKVSLHLAALCAKHNVPIDSETRELMEQCQKLLDEMNGFKSRDPLI